MPVAALGAPAGSLRGLLHALDADGLAELQARAGDADSRVALADVRLLAPVPDPEKIVCLGLNYRDHAAEAGQEIPAAPMWFAKFANSLIGSGEPIVLPPAHAEHVDYEAELAVVIGRAALRVPAERALGYVAGAMPFNDVTARDLQFQNPLWTSGKAIDTFAPVRAGAGHARSDRRPAVADAAHARQRRDAAGGDDGEPDLRRGRGGRVALAHDDAAAGRHYRHGHAGGRRCLEGTLPARRRQRRGRSRGPRCARESRARVSWCERRRKRGAGNGTGAHRPGPGRGTTSSA